MTPRVRAPEFPSHKTWLNTSHPLSIQELRGRVVILDFWTYCCINCLHVLEELKFLEQKYKDSLTVIGVHSAKFENEKDAENIRQATLRYDIEHPVLVDSDFEVWDQYAAKAWPTIMVIDPQGYIVGYVSGEGHREVLDRLVGDIIREHQEKGTINFEQRSLTLEKQRQPLVTPLAFPGKVLAVKGDRLFIADSGHHRIIFSNTEGEVQHVIGAGKSGFQDGSFAEAQFSSPQGLAFDAKRQLLYVADRENHAIRRVDLLQQRVETIAGTGEKSDRIGPHTGLALKTALNSPWDLVRVGDCLLIAMAGSHQIWEMQIAMGLVATYAGTGREACFDGPLNDSAFAQPSGIASDGQDLYIADSEVSSLRRVGLLDSPKVQTICGSGELFGFGDIDGEGFDVRLQHCLGVEYAQNILWVADTYNHKIKRVDPRTGSCVTWLGDRTPGHQDGQSSVVRFNEPSGLSAIGDRLYIADTNNHAIRCLDLDTNNVTTLTFPGLCAPDVCLPYHSSAPKI